MAARKKRAAPKKKKAAKAKTRARKPARRETPTPKTVRRPAKAPKRRAPDAVEEASRESFPASDPPSWTPVTGEER